MTHFKNHISVILSLALFAALISGCADEKRENGGSLAENTDDIPVIELSDSGVTFDGEKVGEDSGADIFISHDVIYYEDKDTYESGDAYGEGTESERHSAGEAAACAVVNITSAGVYRVKGALSEGQIRVDLGEDAFTDPEAVVSLVLDGVDISCSVAPALLFLNVYECDNEWTVETAESVRDTASAGANLIIADGSENHLNGSHVAKIFKDGGEEKKLWKQDGAVYSYMSMNIDGGAEGSGVLNVTADNEGIDTELHLTINGGNINIRSQNDGINTNEDGVSVTTINDGNIHIIAGLGEEGDGIDSNGWLVINGGTVVASAKPAADAGLDSDMGSYINGGTVVALGSTMDWAESDSGAVTMNLQFGSFKNSGDAIVITDEEGGGIFAYDPSEDEIVSENARQYMGAILSSPAFAVGETYNVYIGGTVSGSETGGVYSEITGFSGGELQAYTGTDVMMGGGFGGGMRPDMPNGETPDELTPPEGAQNGQRPERPDGELPDGGFGGELPEDFDPGELPEDFDPGQLPEGLSPEDMPQGGFTRPEGSGGEGNTSFYMQDKVNFFSGVNTATVNDGASGGGASV